MPNSTYRDRLGADPINIYTHIYTPNSTYRDRLGADPINIYTYVHA